MKLETLLEVLPRALAGLVVGSLLGMVAVVIWATAGQFVLRIFLSMPCLLQALWQVVPTWTKLVVLLIAGGVAIDTVYMELNKPR